MNNIISCQLFRCLGYGVDTSDGKQMRFKNKDWDQMSFSDSRHRVS